MKILVIGSVIIALIALIAFLVDRSFQADAERRAKEEEAAVERERRMMERAFSPRVDKPTTLRSVPAVSPRAAEPTRATSAVERRSRQDDDDGWHLPHQHQPIDTGDSHRSSCAPSYTPSGGGDSPSSPDSGGSCSSSYD